MIACLRHITNPTYDIPEYYCLFHIIKVKLDGVRYADVSCALFCIVITIKECILFYANFLQITLLSRGWCIKPH